MQIKAEARRDTETELALASYLYFDDNIALVAGPFAFLPLGEKALLLNAPVDASLRHLHQRLLYRPGTPCSHHRQSPRRLRFIFSLSPQLQRLSRLPSLWPSKVLDAVVRAYVPAVQVTPPFVPALAVDRLIVSECDLRIQAKPIWVNTSEKEGQAAAAAGKGRTPKATLAARRTQRTGKDAPPKLPATSTAAVCRSTPKTGECLCWFVRMLPSLNREEGDVSSPSPPVHRCFITPPLFVLWGFNSTLMQRTYCISNSTLVDKVSRIPIQKPFLGIVVLIAACGMELRVMSPRAKWLSLISVAADLSEQLIPIALSTTSLIYKS
nr:hypothetical protein Iba_chr12cCG17380 [Ipomoea batatas]